FFDPFAPIVMDPIDPNTIYYGAAPLYKTTDRGESWQRLGGRLPAPATALAIAPSDNKVVYVAGIDTSLNVEVELSTDGGNSFTSRNSGLPARYITNILIDPIDSQKVTISLSGFSS